MELLQIPQRNDGFLAPGLRSLKDDQELFTVYQRFFTAANKIGTDDMESFSQFSRAFKRLDTPFNEDEFRQRLALSFFLDNIATNWPDSRIELLRRLTAVDNLDVEKVVNRGSKGSPTSFFVPILLYTKPHQLMMPVDPNELHQWLFEAFGVSPVGISSAFPIMLPLSLISETAMHFGLEVAEVLQTLTEESAECAVSDKARMHQDLENGIEPDGTVSFGEVGHYLFERSSNLSALEIYPMDCYLMQFTLISDGLDSDLVDIGHPTSEFDGDTSFQDLMSRHLWFSLKLEQFLQSSALDVASVGGLRSAETCYVSGEKMLAAHAFLSEGYVLLLMSDPSIWVVRWEVTTDGERCPVLESKDGTDCLVGPHILGAEGSFWNRRFEAVSERVAQHSPDRQTLHYQLG